MEKAKRHDLETEIAEQELREANFRKHELELQKRRSNLDEATAVNNQIQESIKNKVHMER